MKKNSIIVLISALFLLSMAACAAQLTSASGHIQPEVSPQEVTQNFYDDYRVMDSSCFPKMPTETIPTLNSDGIAYIADVVASFDGQGAFDPFICAQDMPSVFTAGVAEISGSQALVEVETDWGTRMKVTLDITDGEWKISKIDCIQ
jgi:hypothetical protein